MRVFRVDTTYDIYNLFNCISADIRENKSKAECILDEIITIRADKEDEPAVKDAIANSASDFIVNNIEQDRIKEMVRNYGIAPFDARQIVSGLSESKPGAKKRSRIIKKEIRNHLENSNKLYLDGMVDFRLFEYKKELDNLLENTIDDYMTKKAYDEFLDLLKYFVSLQETNDLCVYVSGNSLDGYILKDKNGTIIKMSSDEEFFSEMSICNLKHEDILISRLISISPSKIVMLTTDTEITINKTLKKIFEDKIQFNINEK